MACRVPTTFFDATAVVAVHIDTSARRLAEDELVATTTAVCVSALSLTEALAVVDRLTDEAALRLDLEDALRGQWDRYAVVPVDQRCLDRATALLREQPLRVADAIQLATSRSTRCRSPLRSDSASTSSRTDRPANTGSPGRGPGIRCDRARGRRWRGHADTARRARRGRSSAQASTRCRPPTSTRSAR